MFRHRLLEKQMTEDDHQILKGLAIKYSPQTLMLCLRLMPDSSNRSSTSTQSSGRSINSVYSVSEDSSNLSKTLSTFSDVSHRDSPIEASSALTPEPATSAQIRGRSSAAASPRRTRPPSADSRAADSPRPSVTEKTYYCPFCNIYGISVHFKRKFDCKRHILNFHCTDSIWICSHPGCQVVFDFKDAYIKHFKTEHTHTTPTPDEARVELRPQLVFACGFPTCKEKLFEAKSEEDAANEARKFSDHVAKHFEEERIPVSVSDWEYSVQMQNLLRQEALKHARKGHLGKEDRIKLHWHPRSSCEFKKILECRTITDTVTTILFAAYLGSPSFESPSRLPPQLPPKFTRPVRNSATELEAAALGSTSLHLPGQSRSQTAYSQDNLSVPISSASPYGTEAWNPSMQHPHSGSSHSSFHQISADAGFWYSSNPRGSTRAHEAESWNASLGPIPANQTFTHHPSSQHNLQNFGIGMPAVQEDSNQLAPSMDAAASLAAIELRPKTPMGHGRQRFIQDTTRDKRASIVDVQMGENHVDLLTYPPTESTSMPMHSGNATEQPGMKTMYFEDNHDYDTHPWGMI